MIDKDSLSPTDAYQFRYQHYMQRIEDMPVRIVLASGLGLRCPGCRKIHPGIFFEEDHRRAFCSDECWKMGDSHNL